jgi:hypothetical protein
LVPAELLDQMVQIVFLHLSQLQLVVVVEDFQAVLVAVLTLQVRVVQILELLVH